MRMRYAVLMWLSFSQIHASGQNCDLLINSNGMGDYYQKEKSTGSIFHKPVISEIWVEKTGQFVYLNLVQKDTGLGLTLHRGNGEYVVQFHFNNDIHLAYYFKDTGFNTTISIPINKNPDDSASMTLKIGNLSGSLFTYGRFLEMLYKNPLVYLSVDKLNPDRAKGGARFLESNTIMINKTEAERLQQSIVCIFKAIQ